MCEFSSNGLIDMSKIQNIQPNYQPSGLQQKKTGSQNSSFSGAIAVDSKAYEEFGKIAIRKTGDVLNKPLGWWGNNVLQKMNDTQGELQNQLLTNIFTATLAPAVIAWNPISKDEQNTKYYMAWRQPISALIAMGINFPLTMWANSYLDKLASSGAIKTLDSRMCPEKANREYLQNKFKKEYKKASDKKAFLADCNKANTKTPYQKSDLFMSNGNPTKGYKLACYEGYLEKLKSDSKKLFGALYGDKPDNINFKDGVISVKNADGSLEGIYKNIPGFEKEEDLRSFIKEHNMYSKPTRDFMKEEFKFEFYEDGIMKPDIIEERLSKTKAMDFMRKFGFFEGDKIKEQELKNVMFNIRGDKFAGEFFGDSDVSSIFPSKPRATVAINKQISRGTQWDNGEAKSLEESISLKQLLHNFGYRRSDGSLQKFMDMKMSDAQSSMAKLIKEKGQKYGNKEIVEYLQNKSVKDFAANVLSTQASRMGKNFGYYKKYFGIAINLPILAITCTVLNWAYPRIMEVCFPNLSKAKKKGGNK